MPRFQILRMQDTYSAVPLSTVSQWLDIKVDFLHEFISEMVAEGALNADLDLDGSEPVLRFYSDQSKGPLAKTEKEYHVELTKQAKRTNAIAEHVRMCDQRLSLTKEYVDAMSRRRKSKDDPLHSMGTQMDMESTIDEDIMMDE